MNNFQDKVNFIWTIAELLRGPYKKEQYGDVVLPMAVLRRFDCVLEDTKSEVLDRFEALKKANLQNVDPILNKISKQEFNNTSQYDFNKLLAEPDNIASNLRNYINGFSKNARDIIEHFDFDKQITKLNDNNVLYLVVLEFSKVDFHPEIVSNTEMGYIFEELIRKFSENGEAGDHYTPREVIKLMVNILLNEDNEELTQKGQITTVYDCACGTGGMLSVAENYLRELNPGIQVELFGQEINPQSYSICKSDMLIKGQPANNIILGDTFTQDGHKGETFKYMLVNPPFGVEWKKQENFIRKEFEDEGFEGRFGAGLPRISDGSLMFLQHLISKMKQDERGSRIAIIFNGSPLFTGDAGSGESEIRKWIIENDMLEGVVALPDQLFYNTGISTYIWIVSNRKNSNLKKGAVRTGKVQLVNAVDFYQKMRKSLGNKRNEISEEQIKEISRVYGEFKQNDICKIFDNEDFGYQKIVVERPLRLNFCTSEERIKKLFNESGFNKLAETKKKGAEGQEEIKRGKSKQRAIIDVLKAIDFIKIYKNRNEFTKVLLHAFDSNGIGLDASLLKTLLSVLSERDEEADICVDKGGNPEPDPDLRDTENVPLKEDIQAYFDREVKPHVPDAWVDESKTKKGYEIPFTRHFYKYQPLRPTEEIMKEIKELEKSVALLQEKRQAVISEVMTKGLNLNVKMNDSGIKWFGEIPYNWEVKKFGYLFSFDRGLSITKENLKDSGVPCVSYGEIHSKYGFEVNPDIHELRCVDEDYLLSNSKSLLKRGDFIFADTSEDVEGSGNFTHLNSDNKVFAGYHTIIARLIESQNYRYLAYLFDSVPFRTQIRCQVNGIKVFSITQTILKNTKVVLPPLQEQQAIVEYLDIQRTAIETTISDTQAQISKLKEYRQSLISEVVSGKIDVRDNKDVKYT